MLGDCKTPQTARAIGEAIQAACEDGNLGTAESLFDIYRTLFAGYEARVALSGDPMFCRWFDNAVVDREPGGERRGEQWAKRLECLDAPRGRSTA
jgi:hypothetical protein